MLGLGEILLSGFIALLVIKPERLPATALTIGRYWCQFHRFLGTLRSEISQLMASAGASSSPHPDNTPHANRHEK